MDFKIRLENSALLGTSQGSASSINRRLESALDCIKNMGDDCEWGKDGYNIEKKYLIIHIKQAMENANEIEKNLQKIEL